MAYYRFRRYRSRRYRPRRYVRRWFRRRFRRYVNGSSKSIVRMKTSVEHVRTISSGTTAAPGSASGIGVYSKSNSNISVLSSQLYRTYCSLYEEVKCIGMRVSLAITDAVGGSDLPSVQIYTSWDRRFGATEAVKTAADIKAAATYNVATAINNNVAKLTRSIYASDLMEKAQWHDSTLSLAGGVYQDDAYEAAAANPNFFAPALFFCFQSPTLGAARDVHVNLSVTYYMAFRNPKYGGSAEPSRLQDLGARGSVEADGDLDDEAAARILEEMRDDEGDMDDGPGVPAAQAAADESAPDQNPPSRTEQREVRHGTVVSDRSDPRRLRERPN